nr:lytic transglycosylase domain-containing protein [uncultured Brevundimonas sp.]
MLDLGFVLALAQTCAPAVSPRTLAAIAHVESRFDPLAIGVNRGPRPPRRARDAADAVLIAKTLLDRGANLDLGLAQINSANLDWLGLDLETVFDPCRNLTAAATVLKEGYRPAEDTPPARQAALRVALSRYNTGDASRGFRNGYVARIEQAAESLGLSEALSPTPRASPSLRLEASIPVEALTPRPAWDVFGHPGPALVFAPVHQLRSLP